MCPLCDEEIKGAQYAIPGVGWVCYECNEKEYDIRTNQEES